jgi:O-antigen ligase
VSNAQAVLGAAPHAEHDTASLHDRLEWIGVLTLFGVAGFVQFSIAIAQIMLALTAACWVGVLILGRERPQAPRFFWPLAAYAAATLLSAAFSEDPRASFIDSKQLVLFLLVPIAYRLATGTRGAWMATGVMSLGAGSAALGIFQYGLLHFDQLSRRPEGTLGHYMTYSGLLMLVIGIAIAKLLFGRGERIWAALVMPALIIAVVVTSTRTAWVGVCAGAAVLLLLKDFRLVAIVPIAAALIFALAGPALTGRLMSAFDAKDPTRLDRLAMLREGVRMVRAHPLVGVGPNMVKVEYAEYRDAGAVNEINPHLHNVPMQIAAERGLPALALWLSFIGLLGFDLVGCFRGGAPRVLSAMALSAVIAMLAAGMFEYNFGDSEFLMLFLLLVTLPFAAARRMNADAHA